jgi:hypothetical protein
MVEGEKGTEWTANPLRQTESNVRAEQKNRQDKVAIWQREIIGHMRKQLLPLIFIVKFLLQKR